MWILVRFFWVWLLRLENVVCVSLKCLCKVLLLCLIMIVIIGIGNRVNKVNC